MCPGRRRTSSAAVGAPLAQRPRVVAGGNGSVHTCRSCNEPMTALPQRGVSRIALFTNGSARKQPRGQGRPHRGGASSSPARTASASTTPTASSSSGSPPSAAEITSPRERRWVTAQNLAAGANAAANLQWPRDATQPHAEAPSLDLRGRSPALTGELPRYYSHHHSYLGDGCLTPAQSMSSLVSRSSTSS